MRLFGGVCVGGAVVLLVVWLLNVEVIVVVVVDDLLLSGWLICGSVRTVFLWCVCKQK